MKKSSLTWRIRPPAARGGSSTRSRNPVAWAKASPSARRAPGGTVDLGARVLLVRRTAQNGPGKDHARSANSSPRSRARLSRSMAADSTASFASDLSSFHSRCALACSRCASRSSYTCCRRRRNRSVFSLIRVVFGLPTTPLNYRIARATKKASGPPHVSAFQRRRWRVPEGRLRKRRRTWQGTRPDRAMRGREGLAAGHRASHRAPPWEKDF